MIANIPINSGPQTQIIRKKIKRRKGYFFCYNISKVNGDYRSCLQDAVLNACCYLHVDVCKEDFYKECPPKKYQDSTIEKVIKAASDFLDVSIDRKIQTTGGGPEINLLRCKDSKIRLICAIINCDNYVTHHAFIHVAKQIEEITDEHIGVLIDNRIQEPICMIEEEDIQNKQNARLVFKNFFGGNNNNSVRLGSIYVLSKNMKSSTANTNKRPKITEQ